MEGVSEYHMHHDRIFYFITVSAPTSRPQRVSTSTVVTVIALEHSPWVV